MSRLILDNLIGPLILSLSLAALLYSVPMPNIRELGRIGVFGGFVTALLMVLLMQNLWGFWIFHQVDLFDYYRIPVTLSLAWLPLIIIYSHLMITHPHPVIRIGLLSAFPLGATLFHWLLIKGGFLSYHHWSLYYTFFLSLAVHLGIAVYLYVIHSIKFKA